MVADLPEIGQRYFARAIAPGMTNLRWSDANPDKIYRLQPFGGRTLAHATHQGFTIPTAMEIGNLYGTPEYAPFFRARLTGMEY